MQHQRLLHSIDVDEFFHACGGDDVDTDAARRLFAMLDEDGSGEIDQQELVHALRHNMEAAALVQSHRGGARWVDVQLDYVGAPAHRDNRLDPALHKRSADAASLKGGSDSHLGYETDSGSFREEQVSCDAVVSLGNN